MSLDYTDNIAVSDKTAEPGNESQQELSAGVWDDMARDTSDRGTGTNQQQADTLDALDFSAADIYNPSLEYMQAQTGVGNANRDIAPPVGRSGADTVSTETRSDSQQTTLSRDGLDSSALLDKPQKDKPVDNDVFQDGDTDVIARDGDVDVIAQDKPGDKKGGATLVRDEQGNITSITRPDGSETQVVYNDDGKPMTIADRHGSWVKGENGWDHYDTDGNPDNHLEGDMGVTEDGDVVAATNEGYIEVVTAEGELVKSHPDGSSTVHTPARD